MVGYTYPQKRSPPAQASEAKICRERWIRSDPKLERRVIMENCSHPEMHTNPIGLHSDTEEGKRNAPAPSELQGLRIEILDGFSMPGFHGRYFMWPEEYWLLSKYVDLTDGAYLEIGSMCGIIAMSFAKRYSHRRFVSVDNVFHRKCDRSRGKGHVYQERQRARIHERLPY